MEVPSLADMELKLVATEVEYARQRGLLPGEESIVLLDPAGNWLEIIDRRRSERGTITMGRWSRANQ